MPPPPADPHLLGAVRDCLAGQFALAQRHHEVLAEDDAVVRSVRREEEEIAAIQDSALEIAHRISAAEITTLDDLLWTLAPRATATRAGPGPSTAPAWPSPASRGRWPTWPASAASIPARCTRVDQGQKNFIRLA